MRNFIRHFIDARKRVVYAGFVTERKRMQNRIGTSAHRHIQCKGIVDRILGDDIPGPDIFFNQSHDYFPGFLRKIVPLFGFRKCSAVKGQTQSDHF